MVILRFIIEIRTVAFYSRRYRLRATVIKLSIRRFQPSLVRLWKNVFLEVPAFAGMTSVVEVIVEIPAFAGIAMRNRIINEVVFLLIFCLYRSLGWQFWGMKEYFVYMLTNKYHNVLYIGVTNNIRRRIYEHKRKLVYGFTSKYNCTLLVWYEKFTDVTSAIAREKQLKAWQRSWKDNLIEKQNPNWHDRAADWFIKSRK